MNSNKKILTIIIVNFKSKDFLLSCIDSIETNLPLSNIEIIVLNNDSTENLYSLKSTITLINNHKNIGFSRAVNKGIKLSKTDYILLLNPDTIIKNKSFWDIIKFANNRKNAGIIGPKILKNDSKKLQDSITRKPSFLTALLEFTSLKKVFPNNPYSKRFYYKEERNNEIKKVFAVSGACMLIRRSVIKKVGLLDTNFFMYLEDIDYCWRVNDKFDVFYFPHSEILHHEGASSKNSPLRINEEAWIHSRRYFFKKHFHFLIGSILLPILFRIEWLLINLKNLFK